MAKWIGDVQHAERDDSDMPVTTEDTAHGKWKLMTLATPFTGQRISLLVYLGLTSRRLKKGVDCTFFLYL